MISKKKKIIGTLVPLSALSSSKLSKKDQGTFAAGFEFLDWLKKTGQNGWVLLPLSETPLIKGSKKRRIASPYKGYGVGLDPRYLPSTSKICSPDFMSKNAYWLDTYALFCALRDHFKTDDWREWSDEIKKYTRQGINIWTKRLTVKIEYYKTEQCMLHNSYQVLRKKAHKNKAYLIGDLPFYISLHSPLVWANQELFEIGKDGEVTMVSGVLWGHFDRQVWGHPLYRWGNALQIKKVVELWKMRLRYHAMLYDIVRIDHVKGFFKFGALGLNDPQIDKYEEGPGEPVLAELLKYSKNIGLKVFVEDSGHYKLDDFIKAAKKHSLAGMKIYRFAYNEKAGRLSEAYADIHNYPKNSVVYTSTHDTETLVGYLNLLSSNEKKTLSQHAGVEYDVDNKLFAGVIRNAIVSSPARMVIIPIQDWLLTTDRINIPGTEKEIDDPNWRYKLKKPVEDLPLV